MKNLCLICAAPMAPGLDVVCKACLDKPGHHKQGPFKGLPCKDCGKDGAICVGRCKYCHGDCLWRPAERQYRCQCGECVLVVA